MSDTPETMPERTYRPRVGNRLTDLMLPRLKPGKILESGKKQGQPRAKFYPDGLGLYFVVAGPTSKYWVYRFKIDKKQHYMGLGPYPAVSLAQARQKRDDARELKAAEVDPLAEKRKARREREIQQQADAAVDAAVKRTCRVVFTEWYLVNATDPETSWGNEKHRLQIKDNWERFADPKIGAMPVHAVTVHDIKAILMEHWATKRETMSRLRGKLAAMFSYAKAHHYITGDNPAAWADNLQHILPKKSRTKKHHKALPYKEIADFMAKLRADVGGVGALALEWTILNASRTSETTGARWDEIDFAEKIWTVPANRIKAKREHKVPLCDRSLALLALAQGMKSNRHPELIFPGRDGPLHKSVMLSTLQRMGYKSRTTVHGFRSSFKDWSREMTNFPNEVSEAALAHIVGDETERAYARGEMLAKRRKLMEAWAGYCGQVESGNVVSLNKGKRKAAGE